MDECTVCVQAMDVQPQEVPEIDECPICICELDPATPQVCSCFRCGELLRQSEARSAEEEECLAMS